jgi:hypothetical protein
MTRKVFDDVYLLFKEIHNQFCIIFIQHDGLVPKIEEFINLIFIDTLINGAKNNLQDMYPFLFIQGDEKIEHKTM